MDARCWGDEDLLFNGYRVTVLQDEKSSGNEDGKFYVHFTTIKNNLRKETQERTITS